MGDRNIDKIINNKGTCYYKTRGFLSYLVINLISDEGLYIALSHGERQED